MTAESDLTPAIEAIEAAAEEVRQRGLESGHSPLSEEEKAEIRKYMALLDARDVLKVHNDLRGYQ